MLRRSDGWPAAGSRSGVHWGADRTGFPLVGIPAIGLEVSLLPLTWWQLEQFLVATGQFGNAWYEGLLACTPRVLPRARSSSGDLGWLVRGLRPEETSPIAEWLIPRGGRVPTREEWLRVDLWLAARREAPPGPVPPVRPRCSETAVQALEAVTALGARTWAEWMLFERGIGEWVGSPPELEGIGRPRGMRWDPHRDRNIKPFDRQGRSDIFGMRAVRTASPGGGSR